MPKTNLDTAAQENFGLPATEAAEHYSIILDGVEYHNVSQSDAQAISKAGGDAWTTAQLTAAKIAGRDKVREAIKKNVGDTDAILGTTADVTQLNAAAILALIVSYKTGDTYSKQRKAFMETIEALVPATGGGADVYAQAQQFLGGVQSGDIILTAALKGLPEVIGEMAGRSTGVAAILAQAKAGEK